MFTFTDKQLCWILQGVTLALGAIAIHTYGDIPWRGTVTLMLSAAVIAVGNFLFALVHYLAED